MENVKERKIIMWLMILIARYDSNLKVIVWNGSKKFMSVNVMCLKKHLLPKFHISIRRYSVN